MHACMRLTVCTGFDQLEVILAERFAAKCLNHSIVSFLVKGSTTSLSLGILSCDSIFYDVVLAYCRCRRIFRSSTARLGHLSMMCRTLHMNRPCQVSNAANRKPVYQFALQGYLQFHWTRVLLRCTSAMDAPW
jgi:hypothetical protein